MVQSQATGSILRHLLFDLDGTLVDSARLTCAIVNGMIADRGIEFNVDPVTIRAMDATGGEAMIAAAMGSHCRDAAMEIAEFRARHAVVATPSDLAFPGVADGLAALSEAGFVMAICSNKPQDLCEKILHDLQLAAYFNVIIGARPNVPRKPAPESALLAMRTIAAYRATTLYIGDSDIDVATADAANLPFALVGWGYGVAAARERSPAAPVFADMASVLEYILPRRPSP